MVQSGGPQIVILYPKYDKVASIFAIRIGLDYDYVYVAHFFSKKLPDCDYVILIAFDKIDKTTIKRIETLNKKGCKFLIFAHRHVDIPILSNAEYYLFTNEDDLLYLIKFLLSNPVKDVPHLLLCQFILSYLIHLLTKNNSPL